MFNWLVNILQINTKYILEGNEYGLWYKSLKKYPSYILKSFSDDSSAKNFMLNDFQTECISWIGKIKNQFLEQNKPSAMQEKSEIKKAVLRLVSRLSIELTKLDSLMEFETKLVGSSSEGTRPFFPDEYDVLLIFRKLENMSK